MCYCIPSIRTPQCMRCFDYLIQKVQSLEHQNEHLIKILTNESLLKIKPAPIIFCKDCPNINIDLVNKV